MGLFGKPDPRPADNAPSPSVPQAQPAPARLSAKSTVFGEKTRFNGKIETDEPLLINGHVDGDIKSTSEVEVGDSGNVTATVSAKSIVISGKVIGNCTASDRIEIRSSGQLSGSIKAARISIADGAEFKGTSQMSGSSK